VAAVIAAEEGADPARATMKRTADVEPRLLLALWHDTQETRTGGLPHSVQGYLPKPDAGRSPRTRRPPSPTPRGP
jgi:putative hydrolase of HD superfamily